MFQYGARVNIGCLILTVEAFKMLHFKIELTVVILSNTKRWPNVFFILDLFRRQWYSIKPTESQVNVFTGMCFVDKQIYIYLKIQKLSGDFWSRKFEVWSSNSEVWSLRLQFKMAAKKPTCKILVHLSYENNPAKFKKAAKKTKKKKSKHYCYFKSHNIPLVIDW